MSCTLYIIVSAARLLNIVLQLKRLNGLGNDNFCIAFLKNKTFFHACICQNFRVVVLIN